MGTVLGCCSEAGGFWVILRLLPRCWFNTGSNELLYQTFHWDIMGYVCIPEGLGLLRWGGVGWGGGDTVYDAMLRMCFVTHIGCGGVGWGGGTNHIFGYIPRLQGL